MMKFDSVEYWQTKTWDRYLELPKVPPAIRQEFLRQESLTLSAILKLAKGKTELRVLDLACGTGRIAESILRTVNGKAKTHIALADFNPKTLRVAREHLRDYRNASYIVVDAYQIGNIFIDGYFDAVVTMDFLHHISNLDLLLAQVRRVLKPDGVLIGNVFARERYREWDELKYGIIKSARRHLLCWMSMGVYDKSPDVLRKMIRRLGLARTWPLTRGELLSVLEIFEFSKIVTDYYHWFCATKAYGHGE